MTVPQSSTTEHRAKAKPVSIVTISQSMATISGYSALATPMPAGCVHTNPPSGSFSTSSSSFSFFFINVGNGYLISAISSAVNVALFTESFLGASRKNCNNFVSVITRSLFVVVVLVLLFFPPFLAIFFKAPLLSSSPTSASPSPSSLTAAFACSFANL